MKRLTGLLGSVKCEVFFEMRLRSGRHFKADGSMLASGSLIPAG